MRWIGHSSEPLENSADMSSLFDRQLADGRLASAVLFACLDQSDIELGFVDVGARNGSFLLPESYANRACIYGFEPNQAEYEKIISGTTDAKAAGLGEPEFRRKSYYPSALWSERGTRTLYIPVGVGAATLMGPANKAITSNMWQVGRGGVSYYSRIHRPDKEVQVACDTLDSIFAEGVLLDMLKIDAEGGELEVLKGARRLLEQKRVLLIKSEFALAPTYQERVLLGHIQVLLDDLGYRLVDLDFDHWKYCWKPTIASEENDRWFARAGDAIFILDPDRNTLSAEQYYRLGLACIALGLNAPGVNFVSEAGALSEPDRAALLAEIDRRSHGRKLMDLWMSMPHVAYKVLKRLGLR